MTNKIRIFSSTRCQNFPARVVVEHMYLLFEKKLEPKSANPKLLYSLNYDCSLLQ